MVAMVVSQAISLVLPSLVIVKPLIAPQTTPVKIPKIIANSQGIPVLFIKAPHTTAPSPPIAPTETFRPPPAITTICDKPTKTVIEQILETAIKLSSEKNVSLRYPTKIEKTIMASSTPIALFMTNLFFIVDVTPRSLISFFKLLASSN
jgi:hypothetical protein